MRITPEEWLEFASAMEADLDAAESGIKSVHVIMVPWCQCCEARVEIDHICECEKP